MAYGFGFEATWVMSVPPFMCLSLAEQNINHLQIQQDWKCTGDELVSLQSGELTPNVS
jgi:hypothetical protein